VITAAVLKLVPAPRAYATALLGMETLDQALTLLNRLQLETGGAVEAFEFMPDLYMARLARFRPDLACPFPPQPVNILVEIAATAPDQATPAPDGSLPLTDRLETVLGEALEAEALTEALVAQNSTQRRKLWEMRETAAEITLNETPIVDTDISVPLDVVGLYLERMQARMAALDPEAGIMIVAHLGDGNVHYTVYPSRDDKALIAATRAAIAEEAVALQGSFSAEHGVGLSKRPTMAAHKDPVALSVMRAIKQALDPQNILNPGKTIPD
jgi:FAD/FMN-containing dehydrogenase